MSKLEPGRAKTGGRKKGTPNKVNALLKEDILAAASAAHPDGRVGYLTKQAKENPVAFMTLLGKVLPMQITGEGGGPVKIQKVERVIVRPSNPDG
ncbi:hypothetical protein ACFOOL_14975 [Devosia honganensis]|uniref:Uncharacterized protein n=1 Tax=Devosia honganensis TaxID=1610527 RepID=A0ABV7X662_9HYPH